MGVVLACTRKGVNTVVETPERDRREDPTCWWRESISERSCITLRWWMTPRQWWLRPLRLRKMRLAIGSCLSFWDEPAHGVAQTCPGAGERAARAHVGSDGSHRSLLAELVRGAGGGRLRGGAGQPAAHPSLCRRRIGADQDRQHRLLADRPFR